MPLYQSNEYPNILFLSTRATFRLIIQNAKKAQGNSALLECLPYPGREALFPNFFGLAIFPPTKGAFHFTTSSSFSF